MRTLAPAFGLLVFTLASSARGTPELEIRRPDSSIRGEHALRSAAANTVKAHDSVALAGARELRLGPLRVVRFDLTLGGVPIGDRGVGAILGPSGEVRVLLVSADHLVPGPEPSLSVARVVDRVKATTGLAIERSRLRRVWWPRGKGLRSAWAAAPDPPPGVAYAPTVVIDANTGGLLFFDDRVRTWGEARVFRLDPLRTPALVEVDLPVAEGERKLVNDRVEVVNCVDRGSVKQVTLYEETFAAHICDFESTAESDAATGSFEGIGFEGHDVPGDALAQVSAFHHVNVALERFAQVVPGLEVKPAQRPLQVVSNVMFPSGYGVFDRQRMGDASLPLDPFRNGAYFGGPYTIMLPTTPLQPYLLLGQGRHVDTAYDASLVYHEVTHAVVSALGGLGWYAFDTQGVHCAPGAMEEGLADYFAAVISGESAFAPYFATEFPDIDLSRDVDNARSCPLWLSGEGHEDSMVFSGALWRARRGLSSEAERSSVDALLLATLAALPTRSVGFADFAGAFVAAIGASPLGLEASTVAQTAFETSGLLPNCERILRWTGKPLHVRGTGTGGGFIAPGTLAVAANPAPGFFQAQVPIEPGSRRILVSFVRARSGADGRDTGLGVPSGFYSRFAPAAAVSFDAPIGFSVIDGDVVTVADAILDAGDAADRFSVSINVPEGAREAYVMIVNRGESAGRYADLDFAFDHGPAPVVASPELDTPAARGCGCGVAHSSPGGGSRWLALLALLMVRRRDPLRRKHAATTRLRR